MNFNLKNKAGDVGFRLLIILTGLMLNSCESFVAVDLPSTELTGEAVFEDAATAEAALVNIYGKMRYDVLVTGSPSGLSALLGCYADELDYYSMGDLAAKEFYQNNLLPTNNTVGTTWNATYNLIYAANAIIEGVGASGGIDQPDREQLLGEAYFIRVYLHSYLIGLYGEIPYVTSTDYRYNTTISKMSVADCYAVLTTDLQNAIALLPDAYVDPERVRPNRSTVYALLARVKLYSGQWAEANIYSNMVIDNTGLYTWVEDVNAVFLNNSTGTIWQLMPQFGENTLEAQTFIFLEGPPPSFSLSDDLVNAFEAGDLRKVDWIGTVTDGTDTWYYANKYKQNGNTGSSVEYSIMFRLEEQYLIRAEAKAQLGDLDGSKADLNKVRNRAGLNNTAAGTKDEILAAILEERRMEFFTELGHRWFDLKRTGNAPAVLGAKKPGWDAKDLLWPLPENELLLNANLLPQNAGY